MKHPDKAMLRFQIGDRFIYAREVHQPARAAQPFLTDSFARVKADGFSFLDDFLVKNASEAIAKRIKKNISVVMA